MRLGAPLYVGETHNFRERFPGGRKHERWEEAQNLGATHVLAAVIPQEATRQAIEQDLIQTFQPPLNVQKKSLGLPQKKPLRPALGQYQPRKDAKEQTPSLGKRLPSGGALPPGPIPGLPGFRP
jgi:hypothetical protein